MLTLTSSEFIALCRAQVVLLTQALGASLSVVYLTEELGEGVDTQLIPVIAYPETAVDWQAKGTPRSLLSAIATHEVAPRLLADPYSDLAQAKQLPESVPHCMPLAFEPSSDWRDASTDRTDVDRTARLNSGTSESGSSDSGNSRRAALVAERRVVLPLMHEAVVLGLLVTERNDRPWTEWEQTQIHQIADTLAIACVLDQRYQWLKHDHRQQQQLQAQQHDLLDNLLHQFRNSLTALQTFGKLILKRLLPEDTNRELAASLVRETVRLRDLAQQLEGAIAGTDDMRVSPLALPPGLDDRVLDDRSVDERLQLREGARSLPLLPAAGLLASASLTLEPCDIAMVLEPLLASTRAIAQDRSLTLITDIPPALPPVQAAVQTLWEVLSNAIDNALKYTPAGGFVLVQARLVQAPLAVAGQETEAIRQTIELSITDTGPGIPPQDLLHLFERRYRGVQAQTDIPGSGLGLSIARTLVTQMHGEIEVFSPARVDVLDQRLAKAMAASGHGTTVVIRLAVFDFQALTPNS